MVVYTYITIMIQAKILDFKIQLKEKGFEAVNRFYLA
jgi:hypothetical protein